MSITEQAMVLNLQIGAWTGRRLDRSASSKVTSDAHADEDAARVNKLLVPKTALKDITSATSAIRNHFYEKTLPWKDNGDRLLTRALYFDFIGEHSKLVDDYNYAVDRFLRSGYPEAVEQAAFRMGELFKPDDYPSAASLKHKFYVNLDIDTVTSAGDFRVEMDQEHMDSIRSNMEDAMERRLNTAMRDVWERLARVVGRFQERMATKDAIFRDSLVENMVELVEILPGLNVLDDPDIASIGRDIKAKLTGYSPDDLRKHPEVRFEAAEASKEIMAKMDGYMKAFGGAN